MESDALAASTVVNRRGKTILELFNDSERVMQAIQCAVDEAIERHRLLGESIVVERDGQIVEIRASEIEPLATRRARRQTERTATAR